MYDLGDKNLMLESKFGSSLRIINSHKLKGNITIEDSLFKYNTGISGSSIFANSFQYFILLL